MLLSKFQKAFSYPLIESFKKIFVEFFEILFYLLSLRFQKIYCNTIALGARVENTGV
nr:MAG TPA: hypothetical protein [Caudoviricetes sp.]